MLKLKKLFLLGFIASALVPVQQAGANASKPIAVQEHKSFEQIHAELLDHGKDAPLMILAHRGQWREYPENSLAAVNEAIVDGAEIVEIDVQLTADGVPVLMHDTTVDRTTNGKGKVSDFTLAQIKNLYLKEGLGGKTAALTKHKIPTLEEVMLVVKDRAIVNLDKGWEIRDEMYKVLVKTDTVDHGLFKGSPNVEEAAKFIEKDPEILYMHIILDNNVNTIGTFPGRQPVAYEIVFADLADPQVQPEKLKQIKKSSRVLVNVMWYGLAAKYTDEASLRDVNMGWKAVTKLGVNMIQTDNIEAIDYWRHGGNMRHWQYDTGNRTVRVQAEEHLGGGQGIGYFDQDAHRCNTADQDSIDVCEIDGAIAVSHNMEGEWAKYEVNIKKSGTYKISGRVSAAATPAGAITLDWAGKTSGETELKNTTHKRAFQLQKLEYRYLKKGTHIFTVKVTSPGSYNLDYIQFNLQD
ncbi:glycerophosphodiester phosphodiesterase family protein [Peribacillus muralis]|uniref:glycerophosphodiester phosphodiesterase family protein n=1 Tax=Peribacillus muralis TaxID=264697 RepID=UPI003D048B59